jgi:signal transduction histidine kinase
MKLKFIVKSLFNIGINVNLKTSKKKQIRLTNQTTFIMFVSAIPYYFILSRFNLFLAADMVIVVLNLYVLILCLNALKKYNFATLFIVLVQSFIILPFYSTYLGFKSGAHLMYVPLSILPLILYPSDIDKMWRHSCLVFVLLSILFSITFPFIYPNMSVYIPKKSADIIYVFAFLTTFGLVLPQVNFFNRSEQKATKKLERSNQRLNLAIQQLRESKEKQRHLSEYADYAKLVQRIAHEFKNPLQMLQGTAELGIHKPQDSKGLFKIVLETVDRLNNVIQPMLNYFVSDKVKAFNTFDIGETVDDIYRLSKANCKAREIKIKIKNNLKSKFVNGNSKAIGQVIINLLTNSIESVGNNGGNITIELINEAYIFNSDVESGVRCNVIDDGCGISREELKTIFVPYETTKKSSTNVGLGLSIVYKIIEDHNGLIEIDSEIGIGTTVSIWLKAVDQSKVKESKLTNSFELSNNFFQ